MAFTVTYTHPVAGVTAPTALQAMNAQAVIADIIASADGDTVATVTHNFATSVADLAKGFPLVILTPTLSQALTALSAWTVTTKTTNAITLTKLTSTGSGNASPQLTVAILRPWSAMV
jgi:hypothetical protein